ncbi:MAG: DUF2291 domain-containing protein [Prevotellaceae bacterium]|jgi:predicted lipoprotein|nr:DUF2291 domain-containing protein [Prevotellaceae bacterium]
MTTKKTTLTLLALAAAGLALYHSVYVERLSERQQRLMMKSFNPQQQVDYFWSSERPRIAAQGLALGELVARLGADPEPLAAQHGRRAGLGDNVCFVVKAIVQVDTLSRERIAFALGGARFYIPRRFIFGNTLRDAVGCFGIDNFENTMDYNAISTALNQRVLVEVVGGVDSALRVGAALALVGAVEVNLGDLPLREAEVVPLTLSVAAP